MSVLTEIKNRGVQDIFFIVCDGLKGLTDSANAVFLLATIQTCIIHLIRGTFRYASKKSPDRIARELRPMYTVGHGGFRGIRRVRCGTGTEIPCDIRALAILLGAANPVSRLRHRDPQSAVLDRCDRIAQCSGPPSGAGTEQFPAGAGRAQHGLSRDALAGPEGSPGTPEVPRRARLDGPCGESPRYKSIRHYVRRPHAGRRGPVIRETPVTPKSG